MVDSIDLLEKVEKYVLICDICSSTKIIEQLIKEGHQERWHILLKDIEAFLKEERDRTGFDIYKFMGDAWIILFDTTSHLNELFFFINHFNVKYENAYNERIGKVLSSCIDKIGIKYGLEKGTLFRFPMFDDIEYVGIPLIIAARLQEAIKDNDQNPQGKLLMSKSVYRKVRHYIPEGYKVWKVPRELKNVMGGKKYYFIKYEKRLNGV